MASPQPKPESQPAKGPNLRTRTPPVMLTPQERERITAEIEPLIGMMQAAKAFADPDYRIMGSAARKLSKIAFRLARKS